MKLTRVTDFKAGTPARSSEVDAEFDLIHELVNGEIGDDNIADEGISPSKLKTYRGNVPTFADLSLIPNPQHMDEAGVEDEMNQYLYDSASMTWKKSSGTVSTVSHNTLTGRSTADAHPMSSITGLVDEIAAVRSEMGNIAVPDALTQQVADHEGRIDSAEADIQNLNDGLANQGGQITGLGVDVSALENATKPFVQTFKAVADTTLPSGVYTEVAFGTQSGPNWNNTLNCYTIPVTGQYIIQVDYQMLGLTATSAASKSVFAKYTVNGVEKELAYDYAYGPSIGFGGHDTVSLTAGDKIKFLAYATGGGTFDGGSWSKVTIQLIQAHAGGQAIPIA